MRKLDALTDPRFIRELPLASVDYEPLTAQEALRILRWLAFDPGNLNPGGVHMNKRKIPLRTLAHQMGYPRWQLDRWVGGLRKIKPHDLKRISPWLRAVDAGRLVCKVRKGAHGSARVHELLYVMDPPLPGQTMREDLYCQQCGRPLPKVSRQTDAVDPLWHRHIRSIASDR